MNKKGIILPLMMVFGVIVAFYLALYLPWFANIRAVVNYFLMIVLWFSIQALFIFSFFQIGKYSTKAFKFYKEGILKIADRFNKLIVFHV